MIKKTLKFLALLGLVSSLSVAGDIGEGNVTKYEVTIKKLELYNSTTSTWVTMANTPKTVNIAGANPGADVASMISSDTQVPFGTFTMGRVLIADTFTINACIGVGNCTSGVTANPGPGDTTVAVAGAANAQDANLQVDFVALGAGCTTAYSDGCSMEITFASPLVIDDTTTSMGVDIEFDVDNVLQSEVGPAISLDFPTIRVTVN